MAEGSPAGSLGALARSYIRIAHWLSDAASVLAIACLVLLLVLVIAGILAGMMAKHFPIVTGAMSVSWEYEGYLMGAAFMLGMPRALRQGIHIRVTLLSDRANAVGRQALDIGASLIAFVMVGVLALALVNMSVASFFGSNLSTASLTPLWIPESAFALSAVLLCMQLLARVVAIASGLPPEDEKEYVGAPVE